MSTSIDLTTVSPLNSRATAADRHYRDQMQIKFTKQIWYLIASVIALLACVRVARYLYSIATIPKSTPEKESATKKSDLERASPRMGKISIRRLPFALATAFRIVSFRWTIVVGSFAISSVSELAFILGYMAAIFIWLLVDTRNLQAAFWQDRAAHFASAQLPLVVGLAGKNNIISFLTGVSYEKLNVLHRAAARTCLVLLWMHAISRTAAGLPPQFDFTHTWMRAGVTGLAAFTLATLLSIRPIRHMAFEFFLLSHIVLIAIFLICGFFHAREQEHGAYIWPALMLWALDRFLRFSRVIYNNRLWSRKNAGLSNATVELLSEDMVRLTLRRHFTWIPGQHAYIILPSISNLPIESHPFTIASIPESRSKENSAVFLISGRSGLTLRLRNHATQNGTNTIPAFIDGPYGSPPDLRPFTTCILIAGGSGISYTLSLLLNLARLVFLDTCGEKSAVRRIVFVWAVRDAGHLIWISKILTDTLASASRTLTIEPRIYITGSKYMIPQVTSESESGPPSSPSSISESEKNKDLPSYSSLKLVHGRPSIRKLLHDEISASLGPVSVDIAGPSTLAESVRRTLRSNVASPLAVLRGMPSVTLHVETFGVVKA
ncbi:FAD-binding domain-containing protein [Collybia nuda]|uniref:ferric-chelate reductase (NADPH) n=1 Tax=Collybia nuda TaxID=64659 RepID=A0A9P5YHM0_9AGAR|nr:FAD-binding domain-containing protein [Collybia nuda]